MIRVEKHVLASVLAAAILAVGMPARTSAAPGDAIILAPHRAIYEMTLDQSRAGSSVSAVSGRMVYELTGSSCDGYTQNMRFVTEMSTQTAASVLNDLRSSTWEDGAARIFRFNTTQLRDQKTTDVTVGDANRAGPVGEVNVDLTKPNKSKLTLAPGTYFPVQHSMALLKAAKAGEGALRADLYDGSEKGEKSYDTAARIGKRVPVGGNRNLPLVKSATPLDALPAWPITISYFEKGQEKQDATPVYELGFWFFENGVSRKLLIDYGDFAIKGELSDITFLDAGKCEEKK